MKRKALFIIALLITITSCNKIDTTHEVFKIIGKVEVIPWDPEYAQTVVQKIYIEEFTAHTCIYCPEGTEILKTIMNEDSTVIATAIHCTELANPKKFPFDKNHKTPMGDFICEKFNINSLPKAMINRKKNNSQEWGIDRNQWRSEIAKINRNNVRAGIELQCQINEPKQEIEVKAGVTIMKALSNPVQLCIVLQQDSIISGQFNMSTEIQNYVHNHVLRSGFNGNYGIKLTPNGIVKEQQKYISTFTLSYKNSFPYSNIPVVIKNCSVVAYLIDMDTEEIIQAECATLP